ncbi:alkaline phosphatase family protein [Halobacteriales archaeon Cl-PHB]
MTAPPHPTIVFGFDAMDARYLDQFAEAVPTLDAIRADGVAAPLESTFPPWTGSAWPSMYTGTDPAHHGVFDFFTSEGYPDEASVVTRNDVAMPAIWNYLSAVDVPAIVLNVPVTHPAEPIEGVLVPGYLAGDDEPGYPAGIRDELCGGEYHIYSSAECSSDLDAKLDGFLDLIECRTEAAVHLLSEYDWQVAVLQLQKTDAVFHTFDDEAVFREVYAAADEFASEVLAAVDGPVNTIVCSDHGMGPKRGFGIYVNEVLREHGFVTAGQGGEAPTLAGAKPDLMGKTDGDGDADSVRQRLADVGESTLTRLGVTPGDVYVAAERVGLADHLKRLVPKRSQLGAGESVDWRASTAFCPSNTSYGIRINLKGREPAGVVPPDRYDEVRESVIAVLRDLVTPDGLPAFDWVKPREAVYDGPRAEAAEDVMFQPRNWENTVSSKLIGRTTTPVDVHDHKRHGVFLASGPDVDDSASVDECSLTDVAPVVLALAGQPVPARMTGEVPEGLLSADVERRAYDDVSFGTADEMGESDDEVTDRLEDLGYL